MYKKMIKYILSANNHSGKVWVIIQIAIRSYVGTIITASRNLYICHTPPKSGKKRSEKKAEYSEEKPKKQKLKKRPKRPKSTTKTEKKAQMSQKRTIKIKKR